MSKITPEAIRALELRRSGADYRQIGEELGIGTARARRLVERALKEIYSPREQAIDRLRQLECSRLDMYLLNMKAAIRAGETSAIQTAIRISERRSKIWGLDSPIRLEHSGDWSITVKEPEDLEIPADSIPAGGDAEA